MGPGFFDASPEAPRAVDHPDAPEASNWIRGSFDSRPSIRRPPTNPPRQTQEPEQ
jgi:hypothetical protein